MRTLMAVVVALAVASAASAVTISVGSGVAVLPGQEAVIPLNVTGGETDLQAITWNVVVPAGGILSIDVKTGTILQNSANVVDPAYIANLDGSEVAVPGTPTAQMVWTPYSMNAGAFATANGLGATLVVNTADLAPGTYEVLLTGPFGPTEAGTVAGAATVLEAGSFQVLVPEPASLMLLGLGGLFLRRRHA